MKGVVIMRKYKIAILVFIISVVLSGAVLADNDVKVVVNGKQLILDVQPIILNDRVMVPLRAIFQELDLSLQWDELNKIVTGTKEDIKIELTIDQYIAKVNGKLIKLDTPATIINGRTLVPIRFIAESLGCHVKWDEVNRMAIIELLEDGQNNDGIIAGLGQLIKGTWFFVDDSSAIIEFTDNEFNIRWYESEWNCRWTYTIEAINEEENSLIIFVTKDNGVKEKYIIKLYTIGESRVSLHLIDEAGIDTMWIKY